ncbi:NAD(P)/FAD-dependent oxidoreductase [Lysobacter sp. A421]
MALSYYQATLPALAPRYPALQSTRDARACVIGGGFAGLNTALGLVERGVGDVVLLEADQIGFGASGRNGGFVFGGFSLGEASLLARVGARRAQAMYGGTMQAVELIRQRIHRHRIDCDVVEAGVIWANWFRDPSVLRARQQLLAEHYGVDWQWLPKSELRNLVHSRRYGDGLFEANAFHFHPLKYALALARTAVEAGLAVHERSPAVSLQRKGAGWRVTTPEGQVDAEQVVLACGGYLAGLDRRVDASVMPIATYVMTTEPLGSRMDEIMQTRAAVYDSRFAFDYYRPLPDTRLLWGGRISVRDRSPEAVKRLLYRDMLKVFPQLEGVAVDHAWSGLMSYARHQMPQIGLADDGLWLAQAFGGHGVAPTTFAGELVASAIAQGDVRWREFNEFGLAPAWKPAGQVAAQLSYWWAGLKDGWKAAKEGSR